MPEPAPQRRVTVIGPNNVAGNVAPNEVERLPPGWRVATPEEEAAKREEAKPSTLEDAARTVAAGAAGVARGASGGLSDVGATYIPGGLGAAGLLAGATTTEQRRQLLGELRRDAPIASVGGEVIGSASRPIAAGSHVHVHNLVSRRARGVPQA